MVIADFEVIGCEHPHQVELIQYPALYVVVNLCRHTYGGGTQTTHRDMLADSCFRPLRDLWAGLRPTFYCNGESKSDYVVPDTVSSKPVAYASTLAQYS